LAIFIYSKSKVSAEPRDSAQHAFQSTFYNVERENFAMNGQEHGFLLSGPRSELYLSGTSQSYKNNQDFSFEKKFFKFAYLGNVIQDNLFLDLGSVDANSQKRQKFNQSLWSLPPLWGAGLLLTDGAQKGERAHLVFNLRYIYQPFISFEEDIPEFFLKREKFILAEPIFVSSNAELDETRLARGLVIGFDFSRKVGRQEITWGLAYFQMQLESTTKGSNGKYEVEKTWLFHAATMRFFDGENTIPSVNKGQSASLSQGVWKVGKIKNEISHGETKSHGDANLPEGALRLQCSALDNGQQSCFGAAIIKLSLFSGAFYQEPGTANVSLGTQESLGRPGQNIPRLTRQFEGSRIYPVSAGRDDSFAERGWAVRFFGKDFLPSFFPLLVFWDHKELLEYKLNQGLIGLHFQGDKSTKVKARPQNRSAGFGWLSHWSIFFGSRYAQHQTLTWQGRFLDSGLNLVLGFFGIFTLDLESSWCWQIMKEQSEGMAPEIFFQRVQLFRATGKGSYYFKAAIKVLIYGSLELESGFYYLQNMPASLPLFMSMGDRAHYWLVNGGKSPWWLRLNQKGRMLDFYVSIQGLAQRGRQELTIASGAVSKF
jgi:hypothetical protein